MKENKINLFKVSLNTNNMICVEFSNHVKKSRSVEELETLLLEEVADHLKPFIEKLITLTF